MTRTEFEEWLIGKGYKKDRFGNYSKRPNARYKLSTHSVRCETAHRDHISNKLIWFRYVGNYYSKLSVASNGKISGMTHSALGVLPRVAYK